MILRAIVRDTRDPSQRGRIKVTIPQQAGAAASDWIWPVINAGYSVTPKVGDQVWVLFENGDQETPVWIGQTKVSDGYKTLIQRVTALEAEVVSLKSRVSALEN